MYVRESKWINYGVPSMFIEQFDKFGLMTISHWLECPNYSTDFTAKTYSTKFLSIIIVDYFLEGAIKWQKNCWLSDDNHLSGGSGSWFYGSREKVLITYDPRHFLLNPILLRTFHHHLRVYSKHHGRWCSQIPPFEPKLLT